MAAKAQHLPYSIESLCEYYSKVHGIDLRAADIVLPKDTPFKAFMVVSPDIDEIQIMSDIKKHFGVSIYAYKWDDVNKPLTIDRSTEQSRPKGLYAFAHTGEDESDAKHTNKSYDEILAEGTRFANPKECLLMTGYHKFITGKFMSRKSFTRTLTRWLDGTPIGVDFREEEGTLKLGNGSTDIHCTYHGPREIDL